MVSSVAAGKDEIIPFAMKRVGLELDLLHLRSAYLASRRVFASVQSTGHRQSFRGGGSRDQVYDGFVIAQRLATPVGRDEGKQPVLHLVPLGGAGREVA